MERSGRCLSAISHQTSGWMYSQLAISVQLLMEHGLVGPALAFDCRDRQWLLDNDTHLRRARRRSQTD